MLCDICQAKPARIFYTEIVNGQRREQHLCEDCAAEYTAVPLSEVMGGDGQQATLGSIISGILNKYAGKENNGEIGKTEPVKGIEKACPECGTTESDFLKTGRLGCPVCYSAFAGLVNRNFKEMQAGTVHTGREPQHARFIEVSEVPTATPARLTPADDGVIPDSKTDIDALQKELEAALEIEDYESAANLRDEIRSLRK